MIGETGLQRLYQRSDKMKFIKEFRSTNGSWVDDGIVYADSVEEAIEKSHGSWSEDFQQRFIIEIEYIKPVATTGWQAVK